MKYNVQSKDGVGVSMSSKSILDIGSVASSTPTVAVQKESGSGNFALWGKDNKYPQSVLKSISDVTLVSPILDWKARAIYGGGLVYGTLEVDAETGKETFKRKIYNEIEEWLDETDIENYIHTASTQFYHFYTLFPEIVLNKGGKAAYLTAKDAINCRWSKKVSQGAHKGRIEYCYFGDWVNKPMADSDKAKIDVIPTGYQALSFVKSSNKDRFIYPVNYPSPGTPYYQNAPWHVILESWIKVAREIPKFKRHLLENQMSIKYIIRVPEWWWTWKYPDFNTKTESDRIALIKKEHQAFDEFFSGSENSGKSFMYTQRDEKAGTKYGSWEVDVIDDKMKEGVWIEDSQEADSHIYKNLNVDPTLFGGGAGKNAASSGSGSDKRVAWNNYIIQCKPHQDLILKPLQFISKLNGWQEKYAPNDGEKLVFMFKNYMIARLDSGEEITSNSQTQQL